MQGMFQLKTAADLLKKLRHDYEQVKSSPADSYLAFNFFVTAEHMLDWIHPGTANRSNRTSERESEIVLQVCSHIANGAKHVEVEARHHVSVSDTGHGSGFFPTGYFPSGYFPEGYVPTGPLVVELQGAVATELGERITVVDLAGKIMQYWETHPALQPVSS